MNKKFQVFVSSTYSDLKAERQACVEAILTAGHIPAGMELFSAGDESQLVIIKRWIDESDIYMLLLGGRYGSIEPKSGLSYTEIEYQYALDSGKPYFALIMEEGRLDEKVRSEGKNVLELNQPEKYKKFKQLVLSKISKFFSNTDRLQLAIMQSLADIQNRHSLIGWIRGNETVDSVKALNQITELTERNKQLEGELASFDAQSEFRNLDGVVKKLSVEEKKVIKNFAAKFDISITKDRFSSFKDALAFELLNNAPTPRNLAELEDIFLKLIKLGIIRYAENVNATVYFITGFGFEVADKINDEAS